MLLGNFQVLPNKFKRIFSIGDIHGCLSELQVLIDHLKKSQKLSVTEDLVIFHGDYIDRGSDSKDVVEFLLRFKESFPNTRFLKGNHEDSMLMFLGCEASFEIDLSLLKEGFLNKVNGGAEFCKSYGIDHTRTDLTLSDLPDSHRSFFLDLDYGLIINDLVFVHAGVRPRVPLELQTKEDLLWIRDDFIGRKHSLEKTIIFGHTPLQDIYVRPGQIGIDTGLVYGNKLTCLEKISGKLFQVHKNQTVVKSEMLFFYPPK